MTTLWTPSTAPSTCSSPHGCVGAQQTVHRLARTPGSWHASSRARHAGAARPPNSCCSAVNARLACTAVPASQGDELGKPGAVRALRCQLRRANAFYGDTPAPDEQVAPRPLQVRMGMRQALQRALAAACAPCSPGCGRPLPALAADRRPCAAMHAPCCCMHRRRSSSCRWSATPGGCCSWSSRLRPASSRTRRLQQQLPRALQRLLSRSCW